MIVVEESELDERGLYHAFGNTYEVREFIED